MTVSVGQSAFEGCPNMRSSVLRIDSNAKRALALTRAGHAGNKEINVWCSLFLDTLTQKSVVILVNYNLQWFLRFDISV